MNTFTSTCSKKELFTYQIQPDHRLDAIKRAIINRCKQKLPKQSLTTKTLPEKKLSTKLPVGGLPSPPIDEKPRLSSAEIRERIKTLQDEKHKLFQMLKQLLDQENLLKQQKQQQQQEQLEQEEQRKTKRRRKSRWAPPEHTIYSYEQASYYYPSKIQPPYSR